MIQGFQKSKSVKEINQSFEDSVKTENRNSNLEGQQTTQDEIIQLNKELEEKVLSLSSKLKTSNEELNSVIYSISHDLRAPLRAIDGYSRILAQDYSSVLDVEGLRLVNIIRSSAKNMDDLITDLLTLSRAGSSELKSELLNMKSLVLSTYNELAIPEVENKFMFSLGDLPDTCADPTLIRIVWNNLISNAIKYSMPKDKPEIIISGSSTEDQCMYTIKDNGVGFNPDYKNKLFGLFQRLHKASEFEGTGVGLTIIQRIVRRHGGEVWGDSQLGLGAEFSFTLPKRKVALE